MFISQAITVRNPSSHCQVPISQDTNETQILGHLIQPWHRPRASVTCHISNNHSWNLNNHSLGTTGQDTIETQIPLTIDADYQDFFLVVKHTRFSASDDESRKYLNSSTIDFYGILDSTNNEFTRVLLQIFNQSWSTATTESSNDEWKQ